MKNLVGKRFGDLSENEKQKVMKRAVFNAEFWPKVEYDEDGFADATIDFLDSDISIVGKLEKVNEDGEYEIIIDDDEVFYDPTM